MLPHITVTSLHPMHSCPIVSIRFNFCYRVITKRWSCVGAIVEVGHEQHVGDHLLHRERNAAASRELWPDLCPRLHWPISQGGRRRQP